jgi:ABC-2 type transport system permease protein
MSKLLASVLQHLRILAQLARVGVVRKSQFKIEFWAQVLMDCCWYAAHVGVFEILYQHTREIAGWNREHFRVLLGFLFVSDAFMMTWLGQMWRFGRDLKDGLLDSYRVRPASSLFLYAFAQFSLEGSLNMSLALGYLGYALWRALPGFGLANVPLVFLAIALSCWVRFVILTLFSLPELYVVGSDAARFLQDLLHSTSDRPLDIFERRLRLFLLYIVPVGALTQVPAQLVLGRYRALEGTLACVWLIALGLTVFWLWQRGFRRYESARG